MRRTSLIAVGVALLCTAAAAQNVDANKIHPITVPIRDAGTLDITTGTWSQGTTGADYVGKIFDNSCQWTGGGFYAGNSTCEDFYDDGRIPSKSDPNAPAGAEDDNQIDGFEFAYCTAAATGTVDIGIGFWERMDPCAGWVPQQQLIAATNYNNATAYVDLSGLNLPGDNAGGGNLACWIVNITLGNGFCMLSDGDGSYNGANDEFGWSFSQNNDTNGMYGVPSGPIIAGEPLVVAFGGCSYGKPCGTDATGLVCGTGLGIADQFWINTDSSAVGVPPTSTACSGQTNTGCYWFGGWPANVWSNWHIRITASGNCGGGNPPVKYCGYTDPNTGTACGFDQCPSSSGCQATITTSNPGAMPVTGANDYDILVNTTEIGKPAIVFGGVAGQASIPFASGTLCIKPPIKRTPPQSTGGTTACTGSMILRVNDPATSSTILNPAPGTTVDYQGWLRDPMGVGTDVSDAIEVIFQ